MTQSSDLFDTPLRPPPSGHGGCPSIPKGDDNGFGRRASHEEHSYEPKSPRAVKNSQYPFHAGCKDMTTSFDAACKVEENGFAQRMRDKCLEALTSHGMTPKELAAHLGVLPDNTRPRCSELRNQGKIMRTGERRDGQHVLARVNFESAMGRAV